MRNIVERSLANKIPPAIILSKRRRLRNRNRMLGLNRSSSCQTQLAPEARQKVARGKRLCAQPLGLRSKIARALKGREESNLHNCVFRGTHPQEAVLYALSGRVVLFTAIQGRRARRLPLATFCRASGAS